MTKEGRYLDNLRIYLHYNCRVNFFMIVSFLSSSVKRIIAYLKIKVSIGILSGSLVAFSENKAHFLILLYYQNQWQLMTLYQAKHLKVFSSDPLIG